MQGWEGGDWGGDAAADADWDDGADAADAADRTDSADAADAGDSTDAADDSDGDGDRGDREEYSYCDDGDRIPKSYICDDYCDCMGCEDEVPCEDGLGVTRVDLGGVSMTLNLQHDGGKYGVMTVDLIAGIFECLLHGDCF